MMQVILKEERAISIGVATDSEAEALAVALKFASTFDGRLRICNELAGAEPALYLDCRPQTYGREGEIATIYLNDSGELAVEEN